VTLQVAFAIMPFGRKPTGIHGTGAPAEIDFDALWDKVYVPVLAAMDYLPVRADRDIGALIISQMLQRLAMADLVVADLTLPNANVYYEVGVRHAARRSGCVLTSAEWTKPLFDLAQMRQLRYPLPEGNIDDTTASAAVAALRGGLAELTEGKSPVFDALPGYPAQVDPGRASAFADIVVRLSEFQARTRSARAAPVGDRRELVEALVAEYGSGPNVSDSVALELLLLLRDCVGWKDVVAFVASLPERVQRHPVVREQQYLAMSEAGDNAPAVGLLEQLIAEEGESSERRGLLGGRYKRLYEKAGDDRSRRRYLDKAIEQYELGMMADLNAYYPSSNLPRLYRARGDAGDEEKAVLAAAAALAACRRAMALGADDGWLKATLLGAAFDAGDVAEAERLLPEIRRADPVEWQLHSTVVDLRLSVAQQVDAGVATQLSRLLTQLEALV